MKKLALLTFMICFSILGFSQKTKADSIIGKWKYMGAMRSKSVYKTDPAWYHDGKPTPKFEFVEFKKKNVFIYNEKGKAAVTSTYIVVKDTVTIDNIKYQIKVIDQKNLTLYRSFYTIKNAEGKTERVDEEQVSFIKVQ